MPGFTVDQHGVDAFGRPVLMTAFMADWFEAYVAELGWQPRILQGCFMSRLGGGADASDGAHDLGKCLDLETAGRTVGEIDRMVRIARELGAGAYRRDETRLHGSMVAHMHLTLGADEPGSPMAEILWSSYVGGGDGLGIQPPQPDYEWRPSPLVLTPPEVDDMADSATQAVLKDTSETVHEILSQVGQLRSAEADRAKATRKRDDALLELVDELATQIQTRAGKDQVKKLRALLLEPDTTEETP